uniref:VWFD domain-containing protein n=1 Tax=Zooxanthella nutricula TaxID=1333877 RepID=A0A7S2L3U6_9DINO|mmetsp:Transcript_56079/g.170762  ORF Transcript_56079/g.170762 Transcript_56079/m.170762 type:complete len:105 (+) Transcript_56079:1-315(+)
MPPHVDGQNGACGNFNNDPTDDTNELIEATAGRVSMDEMIFHHMTPPQAVPHVPCPEHKKAAAREICRREQPGAQEMLLAGCIQDVCVGGRRYAAQDGIAESEA